MRTSAVRSRLALKADKNNNYRYHDFNYCFLLGTRIFNPDAYCQLCDKEFCNKYFLRTHKANKHGVYETICDEKTAESTNTAPLMSTLPNTVKEELPPFGPEMFDKISRSSPTSKFALWNF